MYLLRRQPSEKYLSLKRQSTTQIDFFPKRSKSYGGILLKKSKNRTYARPISTSQTMHLVLRSSKAVEDMSFKAPHNRSAIEKIIARFSVKYGVRIISLANVGTHLHFHVKIAKRRGYLCFIRAVTAAIAMHVSGRNRWTVQKTTKLLKQGLTKQSSSSHRLQRRDKFWDYRPFTRIVDGFRAFLNLRDYVQINQLEGLGAPRHQAKFLLASLRPIRC